MYPAARAQHSFYPASVPPEFASRGPSATVTSAQPRPPRPRVERVSTGQHPRAGRDVSAALVKGRFTSRPGLRTPRRCPRPRCSTAPARRRAAPDRVRCSASPRRRSAAVAPGVQVNLGVTASVPGATARPRRTPRRPCPPRALRAASVIARTASLRGLTGLPGRATFRLRLPISGKIRVIVAKAGLGRPRTTEPKVVARALRDSRRGGHPPGCTRRRSRSWRPPSRRTWTRSASPFSPART